MSDDEDLFDTMVMSVDAQICHRIDKQLNEIENVLINSESYYEFVDNANKLVTQDHNFSMEAVNALDEENIESDDTPVARVNSGMKDEIRLLNKTRLNMLKAKQKLSLYGNSNGMAKYTTVLVMVDILLNKVSHEVYGLLDELLPMLDPDDSCLSYLKQ